ncbi:NAD(P)-binding protein [Artomyces pyxidatus]|uniref:NAD(P)-binding protein n=1 Tax=Artomyces pyxidatus TaxID=48021 RepID=A0ACB8TAS1_9AGAM|nr:NAD(P)-binding protein [Artomyces pyxidatus]
MSIKTVLVTGCSGFLGSHVTAQLLRAGFTVRGAARPSPASRVKENYRSFGDAFQLVVVENIITSDLSVAAKGVDAIVHVASPVPVADAKSTIDDAVAGYTRILDAARIAGVHKIVVTNGILGLASPAQLATSRIISETDTSPLSYEDALRPNADFLTVYGASRGLADKATWEYAKAHPELDVTVLYPPFIWGPSSRGQVINPHAFDSNQYLYALINGEKRRPVPPVSTIAEFVDVRDVARAHVNALKLPKSDKPKRIIPTAGEYSWVQAVRYLAKTRPGLRDRLPVIEGDGPAVPVHATFDGKSAKLVGLETYISFEETVGAVIDEALERETGGNEKDGVSVGRWHKL